MLFFHLLPQLNEKRCYFFTGSPFTGQDSKKITSFSETVPVCPHISRVFSFDFQPAYQRPLSRAEIRESRASSSIQARRISAPIVSMIPLFHTLVIVLIWISAACACSSAFPSSGYSSLITARSTLGLEGGLPRFQRQFQLYLFTEHIL